MLTIAADFGGTLIKLGIVKQGSLVASGSIEALSNESIEINLGLVSRALRALIEENKIQDVFGGIGFSFPCIVDSEKGKILSEYVKYANAGNFNFNHWAEQEWNLPIVLENDARAALIGEWVSGAGKGYRNIVQLTMGTGLGSAVMIEGKLLKGANFLAGNLAGHMSINLNGAICNCGSIGCLETEASSWILPAMAKKSPLFSRSTLSGLSKIDFAGLFEEAEKGDVLSSTLVNNCLKAWGICAVNMVHAYDPDVMIIGGGIMKRKDIILPYIKEMIEKFSWSPPGSLKLVAAEQVEYAGLLGMDYLVSQLQ